MWTLYNRLIDGVTDSACVERVIYGQHWVCVLTSDGRIGVSTRLTDADEAALNEAFHGMTLAQAAREVKSWDFARASVAVAAMNAHYNTEASVAKTAALVNDAMALDQKQDAFVAYQPLVRGKNVAVIGRFPFLETRFEPICHLSVLERSPTPKDYPDSACEYLLPQQDFVFMTGSALTNKTLPRLLQLSANAHTVLVGPSVPMCGALLTLGVDALAGFVPINVEGCVRCAADGSPIFAQGKMARLIRSPSDASASQATLSDLGRKE